MGLPDGEKILMSFDTIHARDGHTDRHTYTHIDTAYTSSQNC